MSILHWIAVAVILLFIFNYKIFSHLFNGRPKLEVINWVAGIFFYWLHIFLFNKNNPFMPMKVVKTSAAIKAYIGGELKVKALQEYF